MSCFGETFDLIAYAGTRYVTSFTAPDGPTFRTSLADALSRAGWNVESRARSIGVNPGSGYIATSQMVPWCPEASQPVEYVAKTKLWFCPRTATGSSGTMTEFYVMNESETMVQSTTAAYLRTTTGSYANYKYYFVGNPYMFFCFMLGANKRSTDGVSQTSTCIMAGSPQLPKFLQARSTEWCRAGINECFVMWQMDSARLGPLRRAGDYWAGGISKDDGSSYLNNNSGSQYSPMIHFLASAAATTDMWIRQDSMDGSLGLPMFSPPFISWKGNPAGSASAETIKGFVWDAVVVNKAFSADDILSFDGHQFIVFNSWGGGASPYRPSSSLLLCISGPF